MNVFLSYFIRHAIYEHCSPGFFSSAIASRREIFSDLNPDLAAPSVHHRIPFWCLRGIWCARAEDFGFWNISLLLKRGGICHVLYWDISLIGLPPLWLKKFLWKTNWKKTSWKIIANMHCCAPTLPSSAVFLFFFLQTSCCYSDTQPAEAAEGKFKTVFNVAALQVLKTDYIVKPLGKK